MLTKSDLIYFVDPLTDPFLRRNPRHLLVMEKFSQYDTGGPQRGEFTELERGKMRPSSGAMFFEAKPKEGSSDRLSDRLVSGAIANFTVRGYDNTRVIGLIDEDTFVYGTGRRSHTNGNDFHPAWLSVESYRRSDGKKVPDAAENHSVVVNRWVQAADWASAYFPMPEDDEETVRLKLELAKEKYRQRRNKTILLREASERDWIEDVEDMRNDNTDYFPSPRYGVLANVQAVTGSMSVSAFEEHIPAALKERMDQFKERNGDVNGARLQITYDVEFLVDTTQTKGDISNVSDYAVISAGHEQFGSTTSITNIRKQPVLRSAVA